MHWLRESPLGQVIRFASRNRCLLYQEEKPEFVLPWQKAIEEDQSSMELDKVMHQISSGVQSSTLEPSERKESHRSPIEDAELEKQETIEEPEVAQTMVQERSRQELSRHTTISRTVTREQTMPWSTERIRTEEREAVERQRSRIIMPQKTNDGIVLVDWYTTDDPDNPQNWSLSKKVWVTWVL